MAIDELVVHLKLYVSGPEKLASIAKQIASLTAQRLRYRDDDALVEIVEETVGDAAIEVLSKYVRIEEA